MTLSEKQSDFMRMVGKLIELAVALESVHHVTVKVTEWNRTIETQKKYYYSDPPRTKTLKSNHLIGLAVDFAVIKDGKLFYESKILDEMGEYWESIGGTWGGNWKSFQDRPHFEYNTKKRQKYLGVIK